MNDETKPVECATCGESPYYTKAHIDAAVAAERERCKVVVQRAQYRNGHHTHEGTTMGHYDIRMIAEIESGHDPRA